MAELALAASIITVIQLSANVAILGYQYIEKVKRSKKEITALIEELNSLHEVLKILRDHIREHPDSLTNAVQTLGGEDGPVQGCNQDLNILREILELKKGLKGLIERLKWPIREGEVDVIKRRIERHKSLFLLALAVDRMSTSARTDSGLALGRRTDIQHRDLQTQRGTTYKANQGDILR
ncbi:uncharacterized protein LAJ45_07307 [Morchella importuna]|uniref:uncharacterized protein n=1 Tax=Morchella importuna TaxID=1174673 RepID=UPI001E8E10F1|nr:uncharacterized protein LAJ45_07307 [Morchella importuna]KAH8148596.1 hypothetical protein LAJ45_07307 [Morchella importuna]